MSHYAAPLPDLLDDDTWSDDELDYLESMATKQDLSHDKVLKPYDIKSSKGDKAKEKIFSGEIKMTSSREEKDETSRRVTFQYPLPHIPAHAYKILGEEAVHQLWAEFIAHDSDESELILTKDLPAVQEAMKRSGHNLPFEELDIDEDGNEYVDFAFVIDKLAVRRNKAGVVKPIPELRAELPPCCATQACYIHLRNEKKVLEIGDDRPDFRLDVVYKRWVLEKKGIVRVNDTPAILLDADIEHDKDKLPEQYWILHGDELLLNYEKLAEVVDKIRLDNDDKDNQMDLYRLPRWLMNEFIPQEVAMFRHHFMVSRTTILLKRLNVFSTVLQLLPLFLFPKLIMILLPYRINFYHLFEFYQLNSLGVCLCVCLSDD